MYIDQHDSIGLPNHCAGGSLQVGQRYSGNEPSK